MKKISIIALFLIIILTVAACGSPKNNNPVTSTENNSVIENPTDNSVIASPTPKVMSKPVVTTTPSVAPAPVNKTVSIQNLAFNPKVVTISKGSSITWTNLDNVTHQIKSNSFNSTALNQGQSFTFTFKTVGTFNYSCAIHPTMTGQVIVE